MRVLGIDPGLANTGWGVIVSHQGRAHCMAYGCIKTLPSDELTVRLLAIYQDIKQVIEKYQPDHVGIEQVFFGNNSSSALATGQARGAVLVACAEASLALGEYTPLQIKQSVVGSGSADKKQVQFMVQRLLRLDHIPKPDHSADALAAALCYFNEHHMQQLLQSYKGDLT